MRTTTSNPVRSAHARLANVRRWHPTDAVAIAAAQRALQVARAVAMAAEAARLLAGEDA